MANEGEADQAALLRGILENMAANELTRGGGSAENVAQLLAAAIAQVGQTIVAPGQPSEEEEEEEDGATTVALQEVDGFNSGTRELEAAGSSENINPQGSMAGEGGEGAGMVGCESPTTQPRPRPICVKFPIELRLKIITMRKAGSKCKDIAKELKVSVSGVKKVWERFLATGMVHDRKPSTYAGRPRKYTYSQESPITPNFETQYISEEEIEVFQTSSGKMDYVTTATVEGGPTSPLTPHTGTPITNGAEIDTMIITDNNEVFSDGPLGATVEIVETPTPANFTPRGSQKGKKKAPTYRGELLVRLVEDCPLAVMKETTDTAQNAHLQNLQVSVNKPLYMEYVLGHPFGKVPSPKPFEANIDEAKVILSDPSVPIGKEMLAALGYSTKVYFNACCKPSPLFASEKVLVSLPLSLGPGHMAETMVAVLQLLLNLCQHPVEALERLPNFIGPAVSVFVSEGDVTLSRAVATPAKLSEYWNHLYGYAELLECCENFLSATPPSAPCLLCHPFESFAQKLEIKDASTSSTPLTPLPPSHSHPLIEEKELPPVVAEALTPFALQPAPLGSRKGPQPDSNTSVTPPPPSPPASTGISSDTDPVMVTVLERKEGPASPTDSNRDKADRQATASSPQKLRRSARFASKSLDSSTPQEPASPKRKRQESPLSPDQSPEPSPSSSSSSPTSLLPPAKRTRQALVADAVARESGGKHPGQWSVEEVAAFVNKIPHCNYTDIFKEHEVDGESLLSLDPEIMVKLMQLKTGPALRIHRHIAALKQQFNISS